MRTVVGMKNSIKPSIERLINQAVAIETESAQDAGSQGLIKNQLRLKTSLSSKCAGNTCIHVVEGYRGLHKQTKLLPSFSKAILT